jgi:small subunit ribosomal protein YMR-31
MNATKALARQPMIRFLGKRTTPSQIDHTPHVHPASPMKELPSSFKAYRQKAQQHGPLNANASGLVGGHIGGAAGKNLGPVEAGKGLYFDLTYTRASRLHLRPFSHTHLAANVPRDCIPPPPIPVN